MIKLDLVLSTDNNFIPFVSIFALFIVAAIADIGGGYLVWLWLRQKRKILFGLTGGLVLFAYGIVPTFQPSNFGRIYAAYGGIFVVMAIIWGLIIDKKIPDRYEIIGGFIVLLGALIIFYSPR